MRKDKNAYLTYEKVKKLISIIEFKDVIDLGCGDTNLLSEIKKIKSLQKYKINFVGAGYEVLKKDININVVDQLDFNKINWFESVKQKFDLILILDVIEHLENPFLFLQQVIKICQKKTKILISVPNIHSYRSRIKFLLTGRPSAFFNKQFRSSSKRNFDDHIWLPAIDLIQYYLRCNNLTLKKIHHIYGNSIFTSHTLLLEIEF
tara:strand:+ start:92 stop:706 length:615 start_codon:yes stop_codon:yes gene_type:complete